jgi:hypothetical protein
MIHDEPMPGYINDKRAVVECDKPECPAAFYIPNTSAYAAIARARGIGWEVIVPSTVPREEYSARCPDHVQGK